MEILGIPASALLEVADFMGFILVAVGLGLTYWQLRATHDWNRRKAAQDATLMLRQRVSERQLRLLSEHFVNVTERGTISLAKIQKSCSNKEVRSALHAYLNFYEALSRGVRQAVYDETLIRVTYEQTMCRIYRRYREYIIHRQQTGSPNAWMQFCTLMESWEKERHADPPRAPTGA